MPRLTISEIAREVGVHKSTVSRQVRAAGLVGDDDKVDLDAYRTHRAQALDPAHQTTGPASQQQAARPANSDAEPSGLSVQRQRKLAAEAERAELDLAERRGELVLRAQAESTALDLAQRLRERVLSVPREVAQDCARLADETAIEARIASALRSALDGLAAELRAEADAMGRAA